MIEIKNLTKAFGKFVAIDDIGFHVEPSSICGLIGYNGAGKTTLLKTAAGIYQPTSGSVLIDGENVFDNANVRRNLFYIPDDLYFPFNITASGLGKFYEGYYPDFNMETYSRILEIFGLDKKSKIQSFSKGMQRQAEIAIGLSIGAKYLLLDESFDGLDPEKRNITKKLLLEYVAEKDCSMIISSHNLAEVADLCDKVVLVNGKKIKINSSLDDLNKQYARFELVFSNPVDKSDFEKIDYIEISIDNCSVSLSFNAKLEEAEMTLKEMSPLSINRFEMTLEEIFLAELEEKEYDTTSLFK